MISLFAPESYWAAERWQRLAASNGCGSKGLGWLVPDRLWGLKVTAACNIHDWMYAFGQPTAEAKSEADRVFLNNMVRLIDSHCWLLRPLRKRRALVYYLAVKNFGGPFYWAGKNNQEELGP